MKTLSVQTAHTINRDGQLVPGNGFKQPTPTVSMHRPNLWMHSIDRTDLANPVSSAVSGVLLLVAFFAAVYGILSLFG